MTLAESVTLITKSVLNVKKKKLVTPQIFRVYLDSSQMGLEPNVLIRSRSTSRLCAMTLFRLRMRPVILNTPTIDNPNAISKVKEYISLNNQ